MLNLERLFSTSSDHAEPKIRVGVLISGRGRNLQALIDHTKDPLKNSRCSIVVVISNKRNVQGLVRAQTANIPTVIVSHLKKSRESFDDEIDTILQQYDVQLICLARFYRILSEKFVQKWRGRNLNIHPALLPSFKGFTPNEFALQAGVRLSGCTSHFVEVEVDGGAIILQESVVVYPNDTIDSLNERVKKAEQRIFPLTMEYVARKQAVLEDGKVIWAKNVFIDEEKNAI